MLRIFKLSRHSKNMIAFGIALRASLAELLSLGLFLAIDVVVFARWVLASFFNLMRNKISVEIYDPYSYSCYAWSVYLLLAHGDGIREDYMKLY